MAKYDLSCIHILNKFVWSELKREFGMDKAKYKNLVPIIPTQQMPVFNDLPSGSLFIVYTYYNSGYDSEFYAHVEQFQYQIYSDQETQLRRINNFLTDLLRRYDWTASDINDFTATQGEDERKFDVKYVEVISATGPEPFSTEGGRQSSVVTGRVCYTHDLIGNTGPRMGMRS